MHNKESLIINTRSGPRECSVEPVEEGIQRIKYDIVRSRQSHRPIDVTIITPSGIQEIPDDDVVARLCQQAKEKTQFDLSKAGDKIVLKITEMGISTDIARAMLQEAVTENMVSVTSAYHDGAIAAIVSRLPTPTPSTLETEYVAKPPFKVVVGRGIPIP